MKAYELIEALRCYDPGSEVLLEYYGTDGRDAGWSQRELAQVRDGSYRHYGGRTVRVLLSTRLIEPAQDAPVV